MNGRSECGQLPVRVEYDLIHDIERRGRNVLEVFRDTVGGRSRLWIAR